MTAANDLLSVENLKVNFRIPEGKVAAVKGVSFRIRTGW